MSDVISFIQENRKFIEERIRWLDSDIRMGAYSSYEKRGMNEMKEFLENLLKHTPNMNRVSGVPYEVDFRSIKQEVE